MGNIPKPILIGVSIGLAVIALAGFVLGFSQTARRAPVDDEEVVAASTAPSSVARDATPLVEPVAIAPPKPKPTSSPAASDAAAPEAPAVPTPAAKPAQPAAVPSEAAPGAPPPQPQPPPTKLGDLPPT